MKKSTIPHGPRQGDILFVSIDKLPKGLKETKSKVIINGTNGHDHSFNMGKLYMQKEGVYIIGYFEAIEGTKILHPEHGIEVGGKLREGKIKPGFYQLRIQNEDTHEGMKPVID